MNGTLKKIALIFFLATTSVLALENKVVYIVSDIRIPFWEIMSRGIKKAANERGYELEILSANNDKIKQMQITARAVNEGVKGIVLSPINSTSAATILNIAKKYKTPVVISDIGTEGGEYVSFVSSNNFEGAYEIGKVLSSKMKELGWDKEGTVGIVSIPQKRANGKARTAGFMKAMDEAGIKAAGLLQQVDFSYQETYEHTMTLIKNNPDLKAIWLQGSDKYKGALDAIEKSGNKDKILLICFDAEPEFLEMIPQGKLVGAAMQQPYLMGYEAMVQLDRYLKGKNVDKEQQLAILPISQKNIEEKLPIIKRNVLGIEE
jgi:ribose transport system substrate-binding protein